MAKKKDAEPVAGTNGSTAPAEKITQRVAVQRALDAGMDMPPQGVPYIKEQFGITLTNPNFSTIKSQLKKAAGGKTSKKAGRPAAASNGPAAHKAGGISSGGKATNPADLARQIKTLVNQYGAEAVKGMADVFAE